ncbi:hypothetical protein ACC720_38575, partial [Rhizobium ruizarguesonis]
CQGFVSSLRAGNRPFSFQSIYATALAAQCFRLLAEERLIKQDPAYEAFMATTRYRLVQLVF